VFNNLGWTRFWSAAPTSVRPTPALSRRPRHPFEQAPGTLNLSKRLPFGRGFPAGCGWTARHARAELQQLRAWPVGCVTASPACPCCRSDQAGATCTGGSGGAPLGVLKWPAFGRLFPVSPVCFGRCAGGGRGRVGRLACRPPRHAQLRSITRGYHHAVCALAIACQIDACIQSLSETQSLVPWL
jgi:hypothetical protein